MNFAIRIIILSLWTIILAGCVTLEERRMESIKELLSDKEGKDSSIEIIDVSYDSVYSTQRNITHIDKIQEIVIFRGKILQKLKDFKIKYADANSRVWLNGKNDDLLAAYEAIINDDNRMCSLINELAIKCNSDPMINHPQSSAVLKYKSNDTIRYGLFIFSSNHSIAQYKIFSQEEYASIDEFINYAKKDAIKYIPNFENEGINIITEVVVPKIVVPRFSILKREREDYNDYTPRTRFHIKTPRVYTESDLNIIADSLLKKERAENGISEIWVNYYLPNKKIHYSNSYGLSVRLKTERSSTIFEKEEKRYGYNPPKPRDLSNENIRTKQLWGAFDQGQIAGYEAGYNDGKKRRKVYYSFDSYYPTSDEWIEQSYKQGYGVGYLDGFDDAGGSR